RAETEQVVVQSVREAANDRGDAVGGTRGRAHLAIWWLKSTRGLIPGFTPGSFPAASRFVEHLIDFIIESLTIKTKEKGERCDVVTTPVSVASLTDIIEGDRYNTSISSSSMIIRVYVWCVYKNKNNLQ